MTKRQKLIFILLVITTIIEMAEFIAVNQTDEHKVRAAEFDNLANLTFRQAKNLLEYYEGLQRDTGKPFKTEVSQLFDAVRSKYLNEYPDYGYNLGRLYYPSLLGDSKIADIISIKEFFIDLQRNYLRDVCDAGLLFFDSGMHMRPLIFDTEIALASKKLAAASRWFTDIPYDPAKASHSYEQIPTNPGYDNYLHWHQIWTTPDTFTKDEFIAAYQETACSDWAKMDRFGKCYGGFWESKDQTIKDDAYNLSYDDNGLALWELPYPKHMILETISIGCAQRRESVPHTAVICDWMLQKHNAINADPTLTERLQTDLNDLKDLKNTYAGLSTAFDYPELVLTSQDIYDDVD
jgi:hypothetical protein